MDQLASLSQYYKALGVLFYWLFYYYSPSPALIKLPPVLSNYSFVCLFVVC